MNITVACVLRSGGVYSPGWVDRLQRQVEEHISPSRFVCLTDYVDLKSEYIELKHDWPGWWSKLELFRPGLFEGPVLYIDLDTLVVGPLPDLLDPAYRTLTSFATLEDHNTEGMPASGVMLWDADTVPIYEIALEEPPMMNHERSDVWWATHFKPRSFLQRIWPGVFGSYKVDRLERGPGDFEVISFHGTPKMNAAAPWAQKAWG